MTPIPVLVFPGGSEIGSELFRSLHMAREVNLYGGTSVESDHGAYLYDKYLTGIPFATEPDFIPAIRKLVERESIQYIFPAHDCAVVALAEAEEAGLLNCRVVTSKADTCRICRSKTVSYQHFQQTLRVPHIHQSPDLIDAWPVFLKPDAGQGSKGTWIAKNREEISVFLARDPSLIILEYLPGPEYTVDCFTDRLSQLRFVGARERIRIQNGISTDSRTVDNREFMPIAETINRRLSMRGVWFFQAKRAADGTLALLEIAPRVSGTMGLYRCLGVNFPLLALYDAMDQNVQIAANDVTLRLDRALVARYRHPFEFKHVYVDLDDCLILNGRINSQLAAFLFQCINRGAKLYLLTRHAMNPNLTLVKHRLCGLFDQVFHLRTEELKSSFIQHSNSIFIDDSFRERMEVYETKRIPVFAPDAIECLLDERMG